MTTVKIMIRCSGRPDVVLTLRPGHFDPVSLRPGIHGPIGHFSVLLLEVDGVDVAPAGIHVPAADLGEIEQPTLTA